MTSSDPLSACKFCQDIWRRFTDRNPEYDAFDIGRSESVESSKCPRHAPLMEAFRHSCHASSEDMDDMGSMVGGYGGPVELRETRSGYGLFWELLLVRQDCVRDHVGTGRILDPDWVDLDIVKQWKHQCLNLHGPKCANPMKIWPTQPAWLIDVDNKCIVSGQSCGAYVALSYRCGEHTGFRVDGNTMTQLRNPNALERPEFSMQLFPILRHAMYLTSAIGERYLWADPLCIVHGDDAATAEQLNLMGAIYASAIVTIIAADGDSHDGLPGLRDVSAPRKLQQRIFPFGEDKIIKQNTSMFYSHGGTPYYERGWAYQEDKMSKRKILFNQKEAHWECQCDVWHEEMILGADSKGYIDPRLGVMLAGFPDPESLEHTISSYNERELRYEEDVLPGIMGLLSVLSRSFTGGFLYGLSEMHFDRSLGWRPYFDNTNLRRRVQSNRPSNNRLSSLSLPSWSWVGWQGLVSGGSHEAARINDRMSFVEETITITEWYTSSSPNGSPLRRTKSIWFENRDNFKDFTQPLPPGWTRHKVLAEDLDGADSRLYPYGCNDYAFKHCSMPDEDCDSWYFPFPVPDIQDSTPPFMPEQTSYLHYETKRARPWAHQSGKANIMKILNKAGRSIGSLFLHNKGQLECFPNTETKDALPTQIELVAIYRSRKYAKTFHEETKRWSYPYRSWETYEVLWVQWVDGVASRLASGDVEKAGWEESDLEDVSLILH